MVIRLSSLGDVILATSVIQPLWEKGFKIDVLTFKPFDDIFQKDHRINRVIAAKREDLRSVYKIITFAKMLGEYDYVIDLHKNLRTTLISLFVKGKTVRYKKHSIRRRLGKLSENFNVVYAYLDTLKELGINSLRDYRPKVIITEEEIKSVDSLVPEKYIAIGTGARYKNKIYPYYSKVADILIKMGYNIVLVGSKEDRESDNNVYDSNVLDLRGKISLRQTMAVISKSVLTISNDSAVAHMARAVSVDVLMLYGATHPYLGFAPLKDEGKFIFKNLPCQPCDVHGRGECKRGDLACLVSISPQEVVDEAIGLIR